MNYLSMVNYYKPEFSLAIYETIAINVMTTKICFFKTFPTNCIIIVKER